MQPQDLFINEPTCANSQVLPPKLSRGLPAPMLDSSSPLPSLHAPLESCVLAKATMDTILAKSCTITFNSVSSLLSIVLPSFMKNFEIIKHCVQ